MYYAITDLDTKNDNEFIQQFAGIPKETTILDIQQSRLGSRKIAVVAQAFKLIPAQVNTINLSTNELGSNIVSEIIAAIPSSVSTLDLSFNSLGTKTAEALKNIFKVMPNIRSLNLSSNKLNMLSDDFTQLKDALPHLETVYLSYEEVAGMPAEKLAELSAVFPNIKQVVLIDSKGKNMEVSHSLAKANLVRALGGDLNVPSLYNHCAFFITKARIPYLSAPIPETLKGDLILFKNRI